jgi:hypothetical protein
MISQIFPEIFVNSVKMDVMEVDAICTKIQDCDLGGRSGN